MSSRGCASKPRKGLRAFIHNTFSRSSSNLPDSSTSSPPPAPRNVLSSGDSTQLINIHTSSAPATVSTETDATHTITNTIWNGLRSTLQGLGAVSDAFPTLSAAAGILLECFDGIEAAARSQQDYEELAKELATMGESLMEHIKPPTPAPMTKCISSVGIGIEQQAKLIKNKMTRGEGGRLLAAKEGEEDVIKQYRQIQSLFRQLQTNLGMSTWSIANEHLVNTRLEALNPAKQATYDSTLSSTVSRRLCTDGTRTEVLSNIDKWLQEPDTPAVYWMNGMAGTGKTTIACTFSDILERRKTLAASFFCTRTAADCRDTSRIIPTIAYQLARYSAPFQSSLYEILGGDPDAGSKNIQKQFERLIRDPLLKVKDAMPENPVVVIDALDECEDRMGVEAILEMLFRHAPDVPLRFFVTSRPEPEIYERMMLDVKARAALHLQDIEVSLVQADIELYLKEELSFMSPTAPQIEQLAQRSGSLFIYAATLVRYIRFGKRFANPRLRLQAVLGLTTESAKKHAEIDALYTVVLKSALEEARMEQKEADDVKLVLRTVLFAQEPISVETIAVLAGLDDPERVIFALQPLRSVLHQSEDTGLVSTLHASFPDFMCSSERSGEYFCDIVEHSQALAERCFVVMKEQLRFNICELESSFIPDKEVKNLQERIKLTISPTLAYACRYWGSHLALASASDGLLTILNEFIFHRLLFWMEVLSLRREISMGLQTILKTQQWLNQAALASSELAVMAEDARNFVTSFASSPVSRSTPHIYISCLPFCPRSSMVYKHYWKQTRGLLELDGSLMERRESAALAIWNMDWILYSVAYSSDGTRVAVGCNDNTVRILSAHDGTSLVDPLQGHSDAVRSVAFSPDSKLIASGSYDHTIRVWNAHNGALVVDPFVGHTDTVLSVAFSPDGKCIVSGSADKTIRIWNVEDGTLMRGPLEGHDAEVYCVAFSPDGNLIASGSDDRTVRLWNPQDGTLAAPPLQGHNGAVLSVAFTPDSTRLVSGSDDRTIRVWTTSEGSLATKPFEDHPERVNAVAISPDGRRVASGSDDCTVRVWNIDDGTLVAGPFTEHVWYIRSWAWDISSGEVIPSSLDQKLAFFISINMMQSGVYLPMIADDYSISVINANDGSIYAQSMRGHTDEPVSFGFSADDTHLITSSRNRTICVWDLHKSSLAAAPFRGHRGEVTYMAISPDHLRVVSCSGKDQTIQLSSSSTPFKHEDWALQGDGWVKNSSSELLFWIPPDIVSRDAWPSPHAEFIITMDGVLHIAQKELFIGDEWSKCQIGD
ncbi:unnamed protein product [Rhizoctonia solani]|uniref:NACHT domain-containing protein n=1 Tax=Rhizoctonia solani TaxID=456999 RepID=A0A8H3HP16_9AGAM|nr:unnamed protein product [Rhizoctonia solani]